MLFPPLKQATVHSISPISSLRLFNLGNEPVPIKSIGYYSNDTKLFNALREALKPDEWEELRNSRLGVFIRFHELEFGWASRLKKYELWSLIGVRPVRFSLNEFEEIIGLNCEYVMNLDHPVVEVMDEMKVFWGQMGVNFKRGPSIEELTAAYKMSGTCTKNIDTHMASLARLVMDLDAFEDYPWGRVAFKFLMESVKKLDITKMYVVEGFVEVLQVSIYNALPEYAAGFGDPVPGRPTSPSACLLSRLNNYVVKDYSEMFPLWDDDVADERVHNVLKVGYSGGWVWEKSNWTVVGTKLWTNVKVEYQKVKTEGGQMETSKKASLTSNMVEGQSRCERMLNTLGQMIESLTKKIGDVEVLVRGSGKEDNTKAGSSGDVLEDKYVGEKAEESKVEDDKTEESKVEDDKTEESKVEEASPKPGRQKRGKSKKASPQASRQVRQTRGTAKAIGSESENGGIEQSVLVIEKEQSCTDYKSVKKQKHVGKLKTARILAHAKSDIIHRLATTQPSPFQGNNTAKVIIPNKPKRGNRYYPFSHVDLKRYMSDRIFLMDSVFSQMWSEKYQEFLDSPANPDGLGRQLPLGFLDYYTGEEPAYYISDKTWVLEVDDIYLPLFWVSASGVPQNIQSGDCGVYCLKYIECHALDMAFPFHDFYDKKVKLIRTKLARRYLTRPT
ncbi:hypothetical protein N665_0781s0003 [Sinapis alba]|nr:hypothetical protein N665_0781s0003 [Sinapis alba]